MPQTTTLRTCPACNAAVLPGRTACVSCGLPMAKMLDLAAAKAHAQRRGIRRTSTDDSDTAPSLLPKLIKLGAAALVLILAIALIIHYLGRPAAQPWNAYPTDGEVLVSDLFGLIHKGDDASLKQAYALISLARQNPNDRDDANNWSWVFKDVNEYLTGEFGPAWNTKMVVAREDQPGDGPILYKVTVATETLHVEIEPQGPRGKPAPTPAHYGVVWIQEFSLEDSRGSANVAKGAAGALRHIYGAEGSAAQIEAIAGTFSTRANEPPMLIKRRLLPLLRNPRVPTIKQDIYQSWTLRQDPTVRNRLESITKDARYSPELQNLAQRVLDGTVTDEELIAAHVPGIN